MTLFYNGFSLNPNYSHCWPSAFFKTGDGRNLSLSTTLALSPQAVLFVKAKAWEPSQSLISANAGAAVRSIRLAPVRRVSGLCIWGLGGNRRQAA